MCYSSGRLEAPRRRRRTASRAAPTAMFVEVDSRNHATTLTHVPVSTVRVRRRRRGGKPSRSLRNKTNLAGHTIPVLLRNDTREPEVTGSVEELRTREDNFTATTSVTRSSYKDHDEDRQ